MTEPGGPQSDPQIQQLIYLQVGLRETTAEAHRAAKDLRSALADYRQVKARAVKEILTEMETAVNAELAKYQKHVQDEMNRQTAALNAAVDEARQFIVRCLTPASGTVDRNGKVQFRFSGTFDEDPEPPPPRKKHI